MNGVGDSKNAGFSQPNSLHDSVRGSNSSLIARENEVGPAGAKTSSVLDASGKFFISHPFVKKGPLIAIAIVVALAAASGWLAWDWQPERQTVKATARLFKAVERRNWEKVRDLMSPDYRDQWDLDRAAAVRNASEVLRQFYFLVITPSDVTVEPEDGGNRLICTLKVEGNGTAVAQMVIQELNALEAPFIFRWQKENWQPWSWRLYSVEQSEIQIPSEIYLP